MSCSTGVVMRPAAHGTDATGEELADGSVQYRSGARWASRQKLRASHTPNAALEGGYSSVCHCHRNCGVAVAASAFEHNSDSGSFAPLHQLPCACRLCEDDVSRPLSDLSRCCFCAALCCPALRCPVSCYFECPLDSGGGGRIMDRDFSTTFSRPLIRTAEISNVGCLHLHLCKYCPNDIGDPVQIATEHASSVSARRAHLARVTCDDWRGARGRSGVGEGRLCNFESSSQPSTLPLPPKAVVTWPALAVDVPVRSSPLHRNPGPKPMPWLFPQRPLCTLGASRAHGRGMVRGGCGWRGGGPEWPCKSVQHPSSTNVTSIVNCIGSSSYLSSHLPRRLWALMLEKRSYTHRLLPECFNS